jgi:hypothetical protein
MKLIPGAVAGAILLIGTPAIAQRQATPGASATSPAAPARLAPVDSASLALAHQIITIAFPPESRSQMYASMMDSIVEQTRKTMQSKMSSGDKDFDTIVDRSVRRMYAEMEANMDASIPDVFESFARAYARDFSRDDLEAILAFVKTQAGQHYFQRAPGLLKDPDVQAVMQRSMTQFLAKLPDIERDNMRDVQDYVAKKEKGKKAAAPAPVS